MRLRSLGSIGSFVMALIGAGSIAGAFLPLVLAAVRRAVPRPRTGQSRTLTTGAFDTRAGDESMAAAGRSSQPRTMLATPSAADRTMYRRERFQHHAR